MDEGKKKEEQAQPGLDEFDEWERMTPEQRLEKVINAPPYTPGDDPILGHETAKRKAIEENAPAIFDLIWDSLREEDREEIRKAVHALPPDENEFALTFGNELYKFIFKFFLGKEQGRVRVDGAGVPSDHTKLISVLPKNHVIPNNKLANIMTRGIIDIGRITLEESRRGAKKPVETSCILTCEGENVHLSGRQPFTEYDRNVYNAVSSLYVYGDQSHIVTPAMVYRAMTGLTDCEKPTAGQLEAVMRSLDNMRFTRARIDCTEELKARRITLNSGQINGGEIDTYLLAADVIKVKTGGQTVWAYRIIKPPILYEYAAAVKQVLTVPASVLDVKEIGEMTVDGVKKLTIGPRLSNTESRIQIKGYLIRRIEGMKGNNGLNNPVVALYDYERDSETHKGLYSIAGKPNAKNIEAKRIRTDVEMMLAYWAATGYIKSFEAQTQRRKITGYIITV